jgi:hypothetical protein
MARCSRARSAVRRCQTRVPSPTLASRGPLKPGTPTNDPFRRARMTVLLPCRALDRSRLRLHRSAKIFELHRCDMSRERCDLGFEEAQPHLERKTGFGIRFIVPALIGWSTSEPSKHARRDHSAKTGELSQSTQMAAASEGKAPGQRRRVVPGFRRLGARGPSRRSPGSPRCTAREWRSPPMG